VRCSRIDVYNYRHALAAAAHVDRECGAMHRTLDASCGCKRDVGLYLRALRQDSAGICPLRGRSSRPFAVRCDARVVPPVL
jgi:hypothetical protein